MDDRYILVNDVGTTGVRAALFDRDANILHETYAEIPQLFPRPGWTEQDPILLFEKCVEVTRETLREAGVEPSRIAAMGIATQRATSLLWDRASGEPVYNAITWQDTRMSDTCEKINRSPLFRFLHLLGNIYQRIAVLGEGLRRNRLGKLLITAAHFTVTPAQSSAHARWILDNVEGAARRAEAGELLFGTVDSWLVWKYTRGAVHATDYSNVSATGMYDPFGMRWSPLLLKPFGLPGGLRLPEIRETSGDFGVTEAFGEPIPIRSVVADQQAALFGEACFEPGSVKCTNGTGSFIDMNTGEEPMASVHRLTPLIAWRIGGKTTYMIEGIISSAGSSVQWLRDNLQIIREAAESQELAESCSDCGGVYVVPAFTGLTAPYWDPYARGTVIGLTRATTREQVVRATLESIAYQCRDVIEAMQGDSGIEVRAIKADGGASRNDFLMQFLADILEVQVERPEMLEATALGAAYLAGMAAGYWRYPDDILGTRRVERVFEPRMDAATREQLYAGWKRAVERARRWA
ncbi:MAG: glycerol kinase [Actinobacteria bacterium]|nr:glycerol kinase [Actinomycetota bacterium]